MSENEKKIDVFNTKPTNESLENEMRKTTQMQIDARIAGEQMGLSGVELQNYIINATKDVSVREDLVDKTKETGTITYNDNKSDGELSYTQIAEELINNEVENSNDQFDVLEKNIELLIETLSQPQYDAPFDYVKMPSLCKPYKGIDGDSIKVAYLNGSDEDVLTNPGIIRSGRFLEILISRKLLEPTLKYGDLTPEDRDSIMLWLRGTSYGHDYPIEVRDPDGEEEDFEVNLDLSELPVHYLNLTPNVNGYFEFSFSNNDKIEYRSLTINDVEYLEKLGESKSKETNGLMTNSGSNDVLNLIIISYNGDYDKNTIKSKIKYLPMKLVLEFKQHLEDNKYGVDMTLNITSPKGKNILTYFPFNTRFFWP